MIRGKTRRILRVALGLCYPLLGSDANAPQAVLRETVFDFGEVVRGRRVEHEFTIGNAGSAPLMIHKAAMTPPLRIERMPAQVPPGGSAALRFVLDTGRVAGRFEGQVILFLNDGRLPEVRLAVEGNVVNVVEVAPIPAFFVAAARGERKEQALEILNHDATALKIEAVQHPPGRFTSRLETVAAGQRYRLTVAVRPDAAAGRSTDAIEVRTSNASRPVVRIPVNLWIHERVYAFPEAVDLGTVPASVLDPAETVMVYQAGGKDFRATARTDLPGVDLLMERGREGDRYQLTVRLRRGKTHRGPIKGVIWVETNDREFPRVAVPVTGMVE